MTDRLAVLLGGSYVAEVVRTRAGVLRLTYTGDGDGTPVSLSMPPGELTHAGEVVENFLDGLLPENDRARAAIARQHGADVRDPLSLLAAVGKDCAGAVQLCLPAEVDATLARDGSLEQYTEGEIEARLDAMDLGEDSSWTMRGEHWSLGGTQGKFALRREGDTWYVAHGAEPTTHILKPGVRTLRAQALIEHVSMRAAALIGLDVAHTEYRWFKSRGGIVIRRFDRARDPGGKVVRRHQEDLCQALGVREKYESFGGPSAARVVQLLRDASPTAASARANVDSFVDGLIYNTVIGAPDAHARNYAVLLDGENVTLAPLYDVATSLAYASDPDEPPVASMSIGGVFEFGQIDAAAWRRLGRDLRLDEDRVLSRARQIAEEVPVAFAKALDERDADPDAVEVRSRLAEPLAAHVARIVA